MKLLALFMVLWVVQVVNAQDRLWYVEGYRPVLESRFRDPADWRINQESNLNSLLNVTLDRRSKMSITIPLVVVRGEDTTVFFCNTQSLRKYYKGERIRFYTSQDISKACVIKRQLNELKLSRDYKYDSIYEEMKNNVLLNRELFNVDDFIDSPKTSLCCIPSDVNEVLSHIYFFFINGILLSEDKHNGGLYYLRY